MNDKKYKVKAQFYNILVDNNEISCRRKLYITRENITYTSNIDLLVVMMNPGSSSPHNENEPITTIKTYDEIDQVPFCDAVVDRTLEQLIKVMDECGFNNTLVINLSDLKSPKSDIFLKMLCTLKKDGELYYHSIFHNSRKSELNRIQRDVPLILAYGVDKKLSRLTNLEGFKEFVSTYIVYGLKKNETLYYHPLPQSQNMKKQWVNTLISQLKVTR